MSNQIVITSGAKVRSLEGVITGTSGVLNSVPLGAAGGVATLDSGGKVPVSQLPSSVVTYLGTWNAATNTPTLTNGVGDAGDMYICNVAGTVNFGAGPVTFAVGDWVLYGSGTWQKSNGQNGTVTSVAASITGNSIGLTGSPITTAGTLAFAFAGTNLQYVNGAGNLTTFPTLISSIGLSMPSAFSVSNSPLTANGTIAVTGAGTTSQYIRGDGSLATYNPGSGGGGASQTFYFNGGVASSVAGYEQMSTTANTGASADFSISSDGYIASFLTDAGSPNQLNIPAGNWNFQIYFNASSSGGTPSFYLELYKYNGSTFTLISSSSANPIGITNGTAVDLYTTALTVPATTLLVTDRLAVRVYVTHSGRTITMHTQDSNLSEVITTFTTGITALNGLTAQVQNFAVGTSGSDFNISSVTDTHTFNLPTASSTKRGALSSTDWTTFNNKQNALGYTPANAATTLTINGTTYDLSANRSWAVGTVTSVGLSSATSGVTIGSSPINTSGTITLAIATASSTQQGLLSSTDWNTFNNKQGALTLTTTGTSGAATLVGNTLNIPQYTDQYVGTVTSVGLSAPTGFSVTGSPVTSSGTLALSFATGYSLPTNVKQSNWDDAYTWVAAFPTQTGNSGKFLTTDGSTLSWASNPLGTVTSVAMTVPTGLSVSGSPITTSGTLAVTLTAGYSIPTTASQSNWDTAYSTRISTANTPLSISSNTISISQANTTTDGYLSSTDWNTFNGKQAQLNGTGFVKASGTTITYDNSTYLTTSAAASTYLALSGGTLTGSLSGTSATLTEGLTLNTSSFVTFQNNGTAPALVTGSTSVYWVTNGGYIQNNIRKPDGQVVWLQYPNDSLTHQYTFPSNDGTLALTSQLSSYLPLTGGTLSGALSGTSASFSSSVTASSFIQSGGTSAQILAADGSTITAGTNITISGGTISASGGGGSMAIGGSITSATAGSVLFVGTSGVLQQNNSQLFWDNTNNRLGIGTSAPNAKLQVLGTIKVATGNAQGILGLGEANGTTVNVGIWRGASNAPTTDGNYLNLGGYDGIVFATGNAAIGSQTTRFTISLTEILAAIKIRSSITAGGNGAGIISQGITNYNSSSATDQKYWDILANVSDLQFRAVNDANTAANSYMSVTRGSGYTITNVNFPNGNIGIGVGSTNAGYKLDVNGTGRFSDNLNLSANTARLVATDATGRLVMQNSGGTTYGIVYGASHASSPNVIFFANNSAATLTLNANNTATFSSSVTATSFFESSSIKGKDIIATNPLLALDIDVIKYTRKSDKSKDIRYGYSAEQIHSLMPELTDKDVTAVKYLDVHTILIAQLQKEIKELKAKLN